MKYSRLCFVEKRRLLCKKSFWLCVILCCCTPLLGVLPLTISNDILSNKYIANPVIAATAAGGIIWAVLSLLEASRVHRTGTDVLTDAVSAPALLPAARMAAQIILATGTALLCALLWIPYIAHKMEYLFSLKFYLANIAVMLVPGWWLCMLIMEGLYQFTRKVEAAALIFALAVGCCLLPDVMLSYSLRWICPSVVTYSDAFPTYWPLRVGLWARIIWLSLGLALYLLSLAAVRKHQRGLLVSFLRGCKQIVLPVSAALLIALAAVMGAYQPFIDHGPKSYLDEDDEFFWKEYSDQRLVISAVNIRYTIAPHLTTGTVSGTAEYDLKNNSGYKVENNEFSFLLNPGYTIEAITLDENPVPFETLPTVMTEQRQTKFTLPQPCVGHLKIMYHGMPTQRRSMLPFLVMSTVDPDYVSLYRNSVMPMMLNIKSTSYGADYSIILPEDMQLLWEYKPVTDKEPTGDGNNIWHVKADSDYIFNLQAGRFVTRKFEAGGIHIDFTYGDIYDSVVEQNDICGAVTAVIDYCSSHYGPLIYTEDDTLSLLQTSALITGGWAFPGSATWMENILTPETLKDEKRGASAKEVFIHELIHHWWGGYGVSFEEEEIWGCEGMTVYSTYRLVKELYGEEYAKKYYVEKWIEAVRQQDRNFYNRHPEYLDRLPEAMKNKIRESNSGVNQYNRMPLMLLKAEQLLGGEAEMDALLSRIYKEQVTDRLEAGEELTDYAFDDFLRDSGLTEEELQVDENFTI